MKTKVMDVIRDRRSTRAYMEEQLKDEEVMTLLEAGNWAPSGHNMQSWHFTVVQDRDLIKRMSDDSKEVGKKIFTDEVLLKMANNPKFNVFYEAPTVIIVSHRDDAMTPVEDISAATQNILLQAETMDLGTCWNGFVFGIFRGSHREAYTKELQIPEGYTPFHAIAVGYPKMKVKNAPKRKEGYYNFIR